MRGVAAGALAGLALALTLLATGPAAAQILTPEMVSPELIDQILGDFFARQGRPASTPAPRESAVDKSRTQAQTGAPGAEGALTTPTLPAVPELATPEAPPSPLEQDYGDRLGEEIELYGYDLFAQIVTPPTLTVGSVPEDYILGIGDEVIVNIVGTPSRVNVLRVDLEGRVVVPDVGPVAAAGRPFWEFRGDLESRVAEILIDAQAYVSLGQVRSIAVAVLGEVSVPGVHLLTGFSSVLDALFSAGGVKKTGSLRRIQLIRGGEQRWYDLYDVLLGYAPTQDLILQDGDRILVPTLGATVAVSGRVRRPAIYELADGQATAGLDEVLEFAGGPVRRSGNRMVVFSLDAGGRERVTEIRQGQAAAVRDGDIVAVAFGDDAQVGQVFLEGHVRVPGRRSLASAPTVRALVPDILALGEFPYLLFAILQTHDPYTNSPVFVPIDLQRVLSGVQDMPLRDDDRVIVLGLEDVRYLWSADVQAILAGERIVLAPSGRDDAQQIVKASATGAETIAAGQVTAEGVAAAPVSSDATVDAAAGAAAMPTTPGTARPFCEGLVILFAVASTSGAERFSTALLTGAQDLEPIVAPVRDCPKIFADHPDLLPFVLEHATLLKGEVRIPGVYPVAPQTPLNNLIAYAGGLGRDADPRRIEILRQAPSADGAARVTRQDVLDLSQGGWERVFVSPGETVLVTAQFRDRDLKPVLLAGEFVRPGLYEVRRGERLSEVIARAGGLTPQAYPYGAVFTRERIKQTEKVGFERAARELEIALATALSQRSFGINTAAGAEALRALADQLRNAEPVGRVVIEADPTILQVRPDLDTVLEGADRIFMPKRPNSVTVIGDVLNEGTLQFLPGARVDEYIDKAGGFRESADEGRVFVVLPNGEAQPVSVSAWNYTPVTIPPGSTVVVPKEPAPIDVFAFIKDITQITSQLAVTAAALAAIDRN
jgi:protein involved in polysaccharide export with SLBB domain